MESAADTQSHVASNFLQLADFVGRFEQLRQDFDVVCRRLGIDDSKLNNVPKREQPNEILLTNLYAR